MASHLLALLSFSSAAAESCWSDAGTTCSVAARNVLILGKTGNGKSTTGNVFAGQNLFHAADEMVSVTQTAQKSTWVRFGVRYLFVDTPGIFDTERSHEEIFHAITDVVYLAPEGFHTIFLQVDPSNRFTKEEQNTVEGLIMIAGREVLQHMALVFAHGDKWPQERILRSAKERRLPKNLITLISELEERVVSVDMSSPEAMNRSAMAMHQMSSQVMNKHGSRPYTNAHFQDARSRLGSIAQAFDPEGRARASEERLRQTEAEIRAKEAELQKKIKEAEETARLAAEEEKNRLRAEMELEYARRQMEDQRAHHEAQLRFREEQLHAERQRAEREHREQLQRARQETQQVIYRDTVSRSSGSWCSIL